MISAPEIAKTLHFLHFAGGSKPVVAGWFDGHEAAADLAAKASGETGRGELVQIHAHVAEAGVGAGPGRGRR